MGGRGRKETEGFETFRKEKTFFILALIEVTALKRKVSLRKNLEVYEDLGGNQR